MSIQSQIHLSAPANENCKGQRTTLYVDHSHLGRHVTGLERITQELFSANSLAPLQLTPLGASGTADLVWKQNVGLPLKLAIDKKALMLCPGFPPSLALSLFGQRVIPYIHDLFLMTRNEDLNMRARLYMAPAFKRAVKTLPRFLVNSQYTADALRRHCRDDAQITLYRPSVGNVFGLADSQHDKTRDEERPLRLIALGTLEPRKNLAAAGRILEVLRANGHAGATLDIVGRFGWGDDIERLQETAGVTLHGYQSIAKIRQLMARADLFINTSHDEGLGLPLLEAQYGGLPVIAPDAPVFREVLGESGLLIDPAKPFVAAQKISALVAQSGWRAHFAQQAAGNLQRWNEAARHDHGNVIELLQRLVAEPA